MQAFTTPRIFSYLRMEEVPVIIGHKDTHQGKKYMKRLWRW